MVDVIVEKQYALGETAINKYGFWGTCLEKSGSQLVASPRPSPRERVSQPDISDSNFRSCGGIGHVIFNELL